MMQLLSACPLLNPINSVVIFYSGSGQRSSCWRKSDHNIKIESAKEDVDQITTVEVSEDDSGGK